MSREQTTDTPTQGDHIEDRLTGERFIITRVTDGAVHYDGKTGKGETLLAHLPLDWKVLKGARHASA